MADENRPAIYDENCGSYRQYQDDEKHEAGATKAKVEGSLCKASKGLRSILTQLAITRPGR
jgi:hypothetical protein